ncbi:MAG TPA: M1 family metallopeptidase, partial [Myxococcales bacterium]|nr:M1 family metallopeptidase [Myxococcales bacterium]
MRPVRYAATLAIDPGTERFSGEISIDLRLSAKTRAIWLHARGLEVDLAEVTAGGATVKARTQRGGEELVGLLLPGEVGPGEARVKIAYRGGISSTQWSGVFREKAGDDWYAFTHFEPTEARAAFPCFDEPGFKVPWQLTLKVPRGLSAASNTAVESEADEGPLRVFRFAPTRPLPTYLVSFAVGPFQRVDMGRWGAGKTPIGLLIPRGREGDAGLAREILGPGLERLEAWFGIPYAYGKLDLVTVPLFFGAMENPGLITFNAEWLLVKPEAVTPERRRWTTYVAVHELAHQWFGNLVTMAWWEDIWLNESFADWLAAHAVNEWRPEWERELFRLSTTRASAMSADSLSSAPSVRHPVKSHQEMGGLAGGSYAITYLKGQEVLWMTEGWLGPEKFRAGVRRHVAAHADGNATAADLFAALGAEAGTEVAPVLSTFLDQSGLPLVKVELRCAAGQAPSLHLSQRRYLRLGLPRPDERLWKIPLCVRYPAGAATARACSVLEKAEQDMPLPEAKGCPAWVMPNDGEMGYYRVSLDPKLWAKLLGEPSPLTRAERTGLLGDLFALVASGDLQAADALAQVPAAVKSGDRHLITQAARFVSGLSETVVTDALRPKFVRMTRQVFGPPARALGLKPRPEETEDVRLLRDVLLDVAGRAGEDPALRKEARSLALAWLADRKAVEEDVLEEVLSLAAEGGDARLHEQMTAAALQTRETRERRHLFSALGSFRAPELVK